MNYKSGDLVKITGNCNFHGFRIGETVRLEEKDGSDWWSESLKSGKCWWVRESDMTPVKPAIMPQKIIIITDGKTTLARLFDGKKLVKRAEAKCAPSDVFDFGVGAELAVKRLIGTEKPDIGNPMTEPATENKPEPVKLYCVKDYRGNLTRGKIYEVKYGFMRYDDGSKAFMQWMDIAEDIKESWLFKDGYLVPLVRRPAKFGELVYIDNAHINDNSHIYGDVHNGAIFKVGFVGTGSRPVRVNCNTWLWEDEYLVLDGYHGDPA